MEANFRQLGSRLGAAVGSLTEVETQARLPGHWSVQQIVEHLTLTYSSTGAIVSARLEKGRPTQATPSFGQRVKRLYVVKMGYFPRGVAAPAAVTPREGPELTGRQLLERAQEHLVQLDGLLERATSLFGGQTRSVSHMILGPLNPGEWRHFHLVHGLHHIRQIEETRRRALPLS